MDRIVDLARSTWTGAEGDVESRKRTPGRKRYFRGSLGY